MRAGPPRPVSVIALVLAVLALPLSGLRFGLAADTPLYHFLYLFDIPLLLAASAAAPDLRRARISRDVWLGIGLLALVAVALAVHPSLRGLHFALRLVEAALLAAAAAIVLGMRERAIVLAVLALAAVFESGLAVAQVLRDGPVGLWALGEFADPMTRWGSTVTPRGTLTGPFVLVAFSLLAATALVREAVAARRPWWLVVAAVAALPVGLSHSRTALLALALACAPLVPAARQSTVHRWALAALVLGTALPAALTLDAWMGSAERGARSDRGALLMQAAAIASTSPLVGVGPALYEDALRARPDLHSTRVVEPVHSVPALFAAESGVPSAVVSVAVIGTIALRAAKRGATTLAVAAAFAPWLLLDQWPYTDPTGIALVGLWLGIVLAPQAGAAATPASASGRTAERSASRAPAAS